MGYTLNGKKIVTGVSLKALRNQQNDFIFTLSLKFWNQLLVTFAHKQNLQHSNYFHFCGS